MGGYCIELLTDAWISHSNWKSSEEGRLALLGTKTCSAIETKMEIFIDLS